MLKLTDALLLFSLASLCVGCTKRATPYDLAAPAVGDPEFFDREQTARWLLVYDTLHLMTRDAAGDSDSMLCLASEAAWQCVAGRFGPSGTFLPERTWMVGEQGPEPIKADHGPGLAALGHAVYAVSRDLGEDWTLYPRPTADGIEVWALPRQLATGDPVIGETRKVLFSQDGLQQTGQQVWGSGQRAVPANRELDLTLSSAESSHPSVGELFFSMYHRDTFRSITIETGLYRVALIDLDGSLGWSRAAL